MLCIAQAKLQASLTCRIVPYLSRKWTVFKMTREIERSNAFITFYKFGKKEERIYPFSLPIVSYNPSQWKNSYIYIIYILENDERKIA